MSSREVIQIIHSMERDWKQTRAALDEQEKALVETYIGFLRSVARTCLERGWRVWFRPNQVVHWGEGGFGYLSILLTAGEREALPHLPGEIRFLADLPDKERMGEEVTLATLDQISYESDHWL